MPEEYQPQFTPLFTLELERIARGEPFTGGVDLSRYDDPPLAGDAAGQERRTATGDLQAACISSSHLTARLENLSLLSEFGRNAWLVHNSQLEALLKAFEEQLMAARTDCELTNKERKGAQLAVEAEIIRLNDRWKKAVGRVLEVELATEALRRDSLGKLRSGERVCAKEGEEKAL